MTDDDVIQNLHAIAYACDGEPYEVFEERVLPELATMPAGEILALSAEFHRHGMTGTALFLAEYGHAVWMVSTAPGIAQPRPDPRVFLTEFKENR